MPEGSSLAAFCLDPDAQRARYKYAGVLAPASAWRARIRPQPPALPTQATEPSEEADAPKRTAGTYRGWQSFSERTFDEEVLECPQCHVA